MFVAENYCCKENFKMYCYASHPPSKIMTVFKSKNILNVIYLIFPKNHPLRKNKI